MKIAFFLNEFPALSQTFILNQIIGLIDLGHEVDIIAKIPGKEDTTHQSILDYKLFEHTLYLKSHALEKKNTLISKICRVFSLFIRFFYISPIVAVRTVTNSYKKENLSPATLLFKLEPLIKNKKTHDIILCHFGPCGIEACKLKKQKLLDGKIVTVFHGYDISHYLKENGECVYNELFDKGDAFLPISNRWRSELIRLGCPKHKTLVHRMGIELDIFTYSPHLFKTGETLEVLSIARLVEKKGLEYGIQAVNKIHKIHKNIRYNIIGDGPLKEDLQRLICDLDAGEHIKLLGWKTQEEISSLMGQAHILLAPSVTSRNGDQEGIPVAIMEAFAKGITVISTHHSGIPELVRDNKTGFLCRERNVSDIQNKLEQILNQPEKIRDIVSQARKHIEMNYDINQLNKKLVERFNKLII